MLGGRNLKVSVTDSLTLKISKQRWIVVIGFFFYSTLHPNTYTIPCYGCQRLLTSQVLQLFLVIHHSKKCHQQEQLLFWTPEASYLMIPINTPKVSHRKTRTFFVYNTRRNHFFDTSNNWPTQKHHKQLPGPKKIYLF